MPSEYFLENMFLNEPYHTLTHCALERPQQHLIPLHPQVKCDTTHDGNGLFLRTITGFL